jgi:hypothetical protein
MALAACRQAQELNLSKDPLPQGAHGGVVFDPHILVDQFGYLPGESKVAVIRSPHVGYDRGTSIMPGTHYEVRRADNNEVVFSGSPVSWNHGKVEPSSGDAGWWFDFSKLDVPGTYFVYDADGKVRSAPFHIGAQVYRDVLRAAMRTFFYQRAGIAKRQPQAAACWTDGPAYLGPNQDSQAHDVTARDDPARVRDLRGGWFDAGDTNKYVTFASAPVHQLLSAYQANPDVFTDDFNIPESGNGLPDLVDEVRWELDWLKRMQFPDGSVALKVGAIKNVSASPPSSDDSPRFYVPACSSATIAAAGMFAHGSYVFGKFPALSEESATLRSRAEAAWRIYQRTPRQTACDSGVVKAGLADWNEARQDQEAVVAAVYLFALTGESTYADYVKAHYRNTRPYTDIGWSRYDSQQGEALLFYTSLPNIEPQLRRALLVDKYSDAVAGNGIYGFVPRDDLYRAYLHDSQYHWGSNQPRANYGNTNLDVLRYVPSLAQDATYRTRALEILHYFHGVNPFAMVYLSNMYSYGATRSANEIYHVWYSRDSKWSNALQSACGPAPGYVPGGPNANAARDGVPRSLVPPTGQPPQKSYRDWNAVWPDSSWAVTEPGIYYQAAYVKLLSAFVN